MGKCFGPSELCHCLENLGCSYHSKNSSHYKYSLPPGFKVPEGLRPFMMVQIGKKNYNGNSCLGYIRELKRLGFTTEQIDKAFKK